jgi:hypothetical protein
MLSGITVTIIIHGDFVRSGIGVVGKLRRQENKLQTIQFIADALDCLSLRLGHGVYPYLARCLVFPFNHIISDFAHALRIVDV